MSNRLQARMNAESERKLEALMQHWGENASISTRRAIDLAYKQEIGDDEMKYTVMHVGYPVAGRPIREDEWSVYSTHATESAAWKRIAKATAHLDNGSWDDHYKVIAPDGHVCDRNEFYASL